LSDTSCGRSYDASCGLRHLGSRGRQTKATSVQEPLRVSILRHLEQFPATARGGAVAIGNFDGVHLGHRRIVERLLARGKELDAEATVFTFDPPPARILRPAECPPPLTWVERKAELIAACGAHRVLAYPTDEALLQLSAREFFDRIVVGALGAQAIVEGPNFFFGHNREGDVGLLAKLAAAAEITLEVVEPAVVDGEIVSSSRVRRAIAAGDVALAARMLVEPYRIRGMVIHGAGRGAKIGFPTANLAGVDTLLPAAGVYAGRAWVGGEGLAAAINIGPNPTFGENAMKVEVHVLDREVALYGQPLEVSFVARLREVVKFESGAELVAQLKRDVEAVRAAVGN
jgi:riboflavin kinase/FMN adenylyltransferase